MGGQSWVITVENLGSRPAYVSSYYSHRTCFSLLGSMALPMALPLALPHGGPIAPSAAAPHQEDPRDPEAYNMRPQV